jgi:hypothetical protein
MNNERSLAKEITEGFEALKSMRNNEPVAWMGIRRHGETRVSVEKLDKDDVPLYAHPYKPSKSEVDALLDNADYVIGTMREEIEKLKAKTLTDEEIIEVMNSFVVFDFIGFARAILRKAQEK